MLRTRIFPRTTHGRVFLAIFAICGLLVVAGTSDWRPVGLHQGYAPVQPIDYSHRLHAGELQVDCLYCHHGARTSKHAGIPATSICMNCHTTVSAGFDTTLAERAKALSEGREPKRIVSPEIAKIYAAMGLDEDLEPNDVGPRPIPWIRVHNLPDFVAFDHSVHVTRGLACAECHGPVQSMERVHQSRDLSMGWCVNCHRSHGVEASMGVSPDHVKLDPSQHVSTDCAACHY